MAIQGANRSDEADQLEENDVSVSSSNEAEQPLSTVMAAATERLVGKPQATTRNAVALDRMIAAYEEIETDVDDSVAKSLEYSHAREHAGRIDKMLEAKPSSEELLRETVVEPNEDASHETTSSLPAEPVEAQAIFEDTSHKGESLLMIDSQESTTECPPSCERNAIPGDYAAMLQKAWRRPVGQQTREIMHHKDTTPVLVSEVAGSRTPDLKQQYVESAKEEEGDTRQLEGEEVKACFGEQSPTSSATSEVDETDRAAILCKAWTCPASKFLERGGRIYISTGSGGAHDQLRYSIPICASVYKVTVDLGNVHVTQGEFVMGFEDESGGWIGSHRNFDFGFVQDVKLEVLDPTQYMTDYNDGGVSHVEFFIFRRSQRASIATLSEFCVRVERRKAS